MDVAFIAMLFLTSSTAGAIAAEPDAAMGPLLALDLGVVFALFVTMPYGKSCTDLTGRGAGALCAGARMLGIEPSTKNGENNPCTVPISPDDVSDTMQSLRHRRAENISLNRHGGSYSTMRAEELSGQRARLSSVAGLDVAGRCCASAQRLPTGARFQDL